LAPRLLGDSAHLVGEFLRSRLNEDGGFQDRAGASDLYYTVFGLEGLMALQADLPTSRIAGYLRGFGSGEELDFVHLCCLARAWAALPTPLRDDAPRAALLVRLQEFRSADGGFADAPGESDGSVYACFLAAAAYQDLNTPLPDPAGLLRCVASLRAADGGYANHRDLPMGLTPPTAAVAALQRQFGVPPDPSLSGWLLDRCHEGGFFATPLAPIPDLLSTATALHALAGMQVDLAPLREACLDYVDSLWTNRGAFFGSWTDDDADCEYTYYGLLALGHLSV
jgi:prenyltransferase beta subunit